MDFFETVRKRKSVRRFLEKNILDKDIYKILEAASLAPSAGNLQSYKIFVVENKDKKKALARACYNQGFVADAPLVLVFCADPKNSASRYGKRGETLYALQDATIAASFAILAATSLGLGSCWVGAFREEEVREILDTDLLPVAVVVLGYRAEEPSRPARKSLEEIGRILK